MAAAATVPSMESHDMFREHGVHLFIGAVQENEHKVKARQKSTVHPKPRKMEDIEVFIVES